MDRIERKDTISALIFIRTPIADTILLRTAEHLTVVLRRMVSAMGCFWKTASLNVTISFG